VRAQNILTSAQRTLPCPQLKRDGMRSGHTLKYIAIR
jgi:hypothetical protein